jgi:hypothetical protein
MLLGGDPPYSISYRSGTPNSQCGKAPTELEIIEKLKSELQLADN